MKETLKGTIERITFHNEDNGYAVLRVRARGRRDLTTVVGHLSSVVTGEYVEAVGEWTQDPRHGLQFKAAEIKTTPPHTKEGLIKYLGSGLVKGIGPAYAKRIVEVFGDQTLRVIDESPSHLKEVKGIGAQRITLIRRSWAEQKGVRDIMVFLQSHGLGTAKAIRIYKTYGDRAVDHVRENPYRLTTDIWGVGFKTADDLARSIGVPENSPLRARAAVRFLLQELAKQGHVGYPLAGLVDQVTAHPDMAGLDREVAEMAVETGRAEGEFVRDKPPEDADLEIEDWLYLKPLFLSELGVARAVRSLCGGDHPIPGLDAGAAVGWVESTLRIELADAQKDAMRAAAREKVLVITGGPGVGKTTIVRGVIEIFASKRQRIGLCAPTGRAAKRLGESTKRPASTIHRLLEFDPAVGGFKRNQDNPLDVDLLVVDEASMVDVILMNQLLRAVPQWACVVFVGDVDQLPSVGPGSVLRDLIDSGEVPVVRLTQIFRQAEQSWIVRAAHAINAGEEPRSAPPGGDGDFYFVAADSDIDIMRKLKYMVRERIPDRFGFDPFDDVQVLAPRHKTTLGVGNLNLELQNELNPASPAKNSVRKHATEFRVGDKVIQEVNNYQREVFNGDIGRIREVDAVNQIVRVSFDGRLVDYEFGDLDELKLAYATTIHKAQGSEYPAIVVPIYTDYFVLYRNLLYTAVTRGKRLVVLVGTRKGVALAARKADTARRFSLLRWRMRADGEGDVGGDAGPELPWMAETAD